MPHVLATDAYKFAMAQAGFPLREETFYFSLRHGGWQYVPLDLASWVRDRVAGIQESLGTTADIDGFLDTHHYGMDEAMRAALTGEIRIEAVPTDTWVHEREPILTITGPSFLVSFLEPVLLWLNYPIQLATEAKARTRSGQDEDAWYGTATCEEHRDLILQTVAPILGHDPVITVGSEGYFDRVRSQVAQLVRAVDEPTRIFEVGMRSAVCMDQHRIALEACKAERVERTSNVMLAHELGMRPVGTMGHEHVQRWGDDLSAFRSMRDMRRDPPSYLLDTFDTIRSGLPAARRVMEERPHASAIRYDSGDKIAQYRYACDLFSRCGLSPTHVLEDGLDLAITREFEKLRKLTRLSEAEQIYGYGGYIVAAPGDYRHKRDRVSAVYKLSQTTGEPRMKFGDADGLGKTSVPGKPVIWRRQSGDGPLGIIAQQDESVPPDCVCLTGQPDVADPLHGYSADMLDEASARSLFTLSPETRRLMDQLARKRDG
jgi:nicotinic acid phosphoribosyltransferase